MEIVSAISLNYPTPSVSCPVCMIFCKNLTSHQKYCKKRYACLLCDERFRTKAEVKAHGPMHKA